MSDQPNRIQIGHVPIDVITFFDAIDRVEQLITAGMGGMIFTPNVDHIVNAETNAAFREAYRAADLSLVDGQPLVWASHLLETPLPEKISGADFVLPLLVRAAARGWRVYLLGAGPGVAEKAALWLRETYRVDVVGSSAPMIDVNNRRENERIAASLLELRPDLILVALGSPKQELLIHQIAQSTKPAVFIGVGASLEFMVGAVKRAPSWMSHAGLEWLYRLVREPRRLWRRYLVNDLKFFGILWRDVRNARNAPTSRNCTSVDGRVNG